MPARRCSIGCESWPDKAIFNTCAVCGEPTHYVYNDEPSMTLEEAKLAKLHQLFEEFYERRCAQLGIPSEGPLPS